MIYLLISKSRSFCVLGLLCLISCGVNRQVQNDTSNISNPKADLPLIIVLGIAQDAGYPQADCKKSCCTEVWPDKSKRRMVSCLGLRDPKTRKAWLFDATPDFKDQQQILLEGGYELDGIFLTHAHMGHYTGLMHLGREAMGADDISVYAMPRMKTYLENNGPWSQLVTLGNINIRGISNGSIVSLTEGLTVTPLLVPHRDEFSETVGYIIESDSKKVLFIPDIDKWEKWDKDILQLIRAVDVAFLDGSFYRNGEIWGRDMSEIPHPFIEESMSLFAELSTEDRSKIHFIHLNHTNPLLREDSPETKEFSTSGMRVAVERMILGLSE